MLQSTISNQWPAPLPKCAFVKAYSCSRTFANASYHLHLSTALRLHLTSKAQTGGLLCQQPSKWQPCQNASTMPVASRRPARHTCTTALIHVQARSWRGDLTHSRSAQSLSGQNEVKAHLVGHMLPAGCMIARIASVIHPSVRSSLVRQSGQEPSLTLLSDF